MRARSGRWRPSHATVVAYLALFVALGGTSYAVATGSIDSREIKNNSVRGKDVRNRTLTLSDIKPSTLAALRRGQAVQGPIGPRGPAGRQGAPGISGMELVVETTAQNSDNFKSLNAPCPAGKLAIASGADVLTPGPSTAPQAGLQSVSFGPDQLSAYADAVEHTATTDSWGLATYAVCAKVAP